VPSIAEERWPHAVGHAGIAPHLAAHSGEIPAIELRPHGFVLVAACAQRQLQGSLLHLGGGEAPATSEAQQGLSRVGHAHIHPARQWQQSRQGQPSGRNGQALPAHNPGANRMPCSTSASASLQVVSLRAKVGASPLGTNVRGRPSDNLSGRPRANRGRGRRSNVGRRPSDNIGRRPSENNVPGGRAGILAGLRPAPCDAEERPRAWRDSEGLEPEIGNSPGSAGSRSATRPGNPDQRRGAWPSARLRRPIGRP
jgi:hypothetical protein